MKNINLKFNEDLFAVLTNLKQVGDREYNIDIKGKKQKFILETDKELEIKL